MFMSHEKADTDLLSKLPYRVFDNGHEKVVLLSVDNPDGTVTEFAGLKQGEYKAHVHNGIDSKIEILVGTGVFLLDGKEIPYKPGSLFVVPRGMAHGLKVANEDTWMLTRLSGHIFDQKTKRSDFHYSTKS
jgi:quercetin dioxygenase-like cupin family protein